MRLLQALLLASSLSVSSALSTDPTLGAAEASASDERPVGVALPEGPGVRLDSGREIVLLVPVRKGEGWASLARRYCQGSVSPEELQRRCAGKPKPEPDARCAIRFPELSEQWKTRCLRALFPADGVEGSEWVHRPGGSPVETYGEGLWQAAEWLTGEGENFRSIRRGNGSSDPLVRRDDVLRLPAALVRPALRSLASPPAGGAASPPPSQETSSRAAPAGEPKQENLDERATGGELIYGEDSRGPYALYRLKPGQALYSAVVVRFTGRVDPEEVNQVAQEIARASGISDVTNIHSGHAVRIPIDLLLPEFLPPGDPRREEYLHSSAEAARYRNAAHARNLDGVHVILDAGHGGVDRGAVRNGISEHEYVYDVLCRIKRRLEAHTEAAVYETIVDREQEYRPRDGRVLPVNRGVEILTDPPHFNSDPSQTQLGVNLRWYLANSIYHRLLTAGVAPEKVVFISLHADSLHPSLRGGMAYIPGERYRRGTFGVETSEAARYREVRERPNVSFSRAEGLRSEGLSRELASRILGAMRSRGLKVHPYIPVRDRIIRHQRAWVPAVLRANQVPVEVLLEIANLNNPQDAHLIKESRFRERVAQAVVDALLRYYDPRRA